MIVLAQQNGAGPIVSLSMGLGSAPASLADAPVTGATEAGDLVLIARDGMLNLIPYQGLAAIWGAVFSQSSSFTLAGTHVRGLLQMANEEVVIVNLSSASELSAPPGAVIGFQLMGTAPIEILPETGVTVNGSNGAITLPIGSNGIVAAYALTANPDGETWTLSD